MNGVYAPSFSVGDKVLIVWNKGEYGQSRQYIVGGNKHMNYTLVDLLTGEFLTAPQDTLSDLQEIIQRDIDNGRIKFVQAF